MIKTDHCARSASSVCYEPGPECCRTVCLACGTRLTCRRTPRETRCVPNGKTTTGETATMEARAGTWLRYSAFALLLMISGLLLVRGQSPAGPSIKVVDLIPASLRGQANQES